MKRFLWLILILLFIGALLVLVPSGTLAEVIELTETEDPKLGPTEDGYIYEDGNPDPVGYQDPTISVSITRGFYGVTSYVAARVKLSSAMQFRTCLSGRWGSSNTVAGTSLAKSMKAVFAVNGDYYTSKDGNGYVVRQGKQYRLACQNRRYDVLVIDYNGDMHILETPDNSEVEALTASLDGGVYQAFTFGPGLIVDGVKRSGFTDASVGATVRAQRMCIAQVGPLEYLLIACSGPDDQKVDGSTGLLLDEFADLVGSFDGITNAYNLDGGSCSTMVFRTAGKAYDKINATRGSKTRYLVDIIYFASAWKAGN